VFLHVAELGERVRTVMDCAEVGLLPSVDSKVIKEVVPLVEELVTALFHAHEALRPLLRDRIVNLQEVVVAALWNMKLDTIVFGIESLS